MSPRAAGCLLRPGHPAAALSRDTDRFTQINCVHQVNEMGRPILAFPRLLGNGIRGGEWGRNRGFRWTRSQPSGHLPFSVNWPNAHSGSSIALSGVYGARVTTGLSVSPDQESVPNRCPTGMKTDTLGATAGQAKARVVARLAHPCFPLGPLIGALNQQDCPTLAFCEGNLAAPSWLNSNSIRREPAYALG